MEIKHTTLRLTRKEGLIGKSGFATLEMLTALTLITVVISAVFMMVFSGQTNSVGLQTNQEALYKVKALLADAVALAKQDIFSVENCDDAGAIQCPGVVDSFY